MLAIILLLSSFWSKLIWQYFWLYSYLPFCLFCEVILSLLTVILATFSKYKVSCVPLLSCAGHRARRPLVVPSICLPVARCPGICSVLAPSLAAAPCPTLPWVLRTPPLPPSKILQCDLSYQNYLMFYYFIVTHVHIISCLCT